jgi:hypothetical protein
VQGRVVPQEKEQSIAEQSIAVLVKEKEKELRAKATVEEAKRKKR